MGCTGPDEVVAAKLVWDVNVLGHNIRGRRRLTLKVNSLIEQVDKVGPAEKFRLKAKVRQPPQPPWCRQAYRTALVRVLSARWQIAVLKTEMKELAEWEPQLRARKVMNAGSAFVTFKRTVALDDFRRDVRCHPLQRSRISPCEVATLWPLSLGS
jgi:hypothetical protein